MQKLQYPPSYRQKAVYDAWDNTKKNLLIEAVAGSGKTTVLLEVLSRCKDEALFLAFNKSIQVEIQTYINANGIESAKAMTLHSLGFMALRRKFESVGLNNSKYYNMANAVKNFNLGLFGKMKNGDAFKMVQMLINMNKVSRMFLTDDVDEIYEAMVNMDSHIHESPHLERLWEEFVELRDESYKGDEIEIDFIDMIYMPVRFGYHIPVKPKYIFIDEAQDLNMTQHLLIDNILKQGDVERWVSVGDRNQCQPKGTKVLMSDMTEKNIEDLQIGDKVVSYHIKKCQFTGFGNSHNVKHTQVLDTHISRRADNLFKVTLDSGQVSSYTSNHKCYLQLSEERMKGWYCLYMMRKGKNYRVGISPAYTKHKTNAFAPVMRARAEGADDLWVLKVFNSRREAFLHEQIVSYKFKIPQIRFRDNMKSKILNQEYLDIFWHEFKHQKMCATNLLKEFNREIEFPLWSNTNSCQGGLGNSWKLSSHGMFKTQACNIIPEIMDMCIFDESNVDEKGRVRKKMIPIKDLYVDLEVAEFISLDIEENHNYVADGILTSNSIYGFAGAHTSSFDLFKEKDNVEEFPLDICYRLPKKVLAEANKVYDVMQGFKEHDGTVSTVYDESLVKPGSMIVCRNTSPLFEMYFKLVSVNKQVYMKGEDIKNRMINFLKPMKFDTLVRLKSKVRIKIEKLKKSGVPINKFQASKLEENIECVDIMINGGFISDSDKVDSLIGKLNNIFIETEGAIKLCTIHKSKGLEEDVVYILDEFLIPSKWAKSKNQLIQEENLKYVARTRAKSELHYLNSIEDIKQHTHQESKVVKNEG